MKFSARGLSIRLLLIVLSLACTTTDAQELRSPTQSRLFASTDGFSESTLRISAPKQKATKDKASIRKGTDKHPNSLVHADPKIEPSEMPAEKSTQLEKKEGRAKASALKLPKAKPQKPRTSQAKNPAPKLFRPSTPTVAAKRVTAGRNNQSPSFATQIGSYSLASEQSFSRERQVISDRYVIPAQALQPQPLRISQGRTNSMLSEPTVPPDFDTAIEYSEDECETCCPSSFYRGSWFGGAEYLFVRPTFSEASAYLQIDIDAGGNRTHAYTSYDFGYEGGFRTFLGYQFCECGGELLFTYTDFGGEAAAQSGTADYPSTAPVLIIGHLDVNPDTGEYLRTRATVGLNTYDFDFTKSLSYDGPSDPCDDGCCSCPRWDLRWSAGVRIADVNWGLTSESIATSGAVQRTALVNMDFHGAGPRVGLEGRRYARSGRWLLFARGNLSLLLGDYEFSRTKIKAVTDTETISTTRVIPVTEIEVGGTLRASRNLSLTAGYLFHAWHDLGMTDSIPSDVGSINSNANILSFDGLFVRGEWAF